MNVVKAYVPCDKCSYYQVALYEGYDITFNLFDADVCIDDPIRFFKRIKYIKDEVKCTLWGDTVYNALYYRDDLINYDKFIVPSYWNFEMFTKLGVKPKAVVKRHIKPVFPNVKKDNLFVTLGESRYFDRKNLVLADAITREFNVRDKTIIVGNMGNADYQTFELSEVQKYELYARSKFYLALSRSEGFGIPPIEAMAVGVVPIFLNAHGHRENLIGIPLDPIDEYTLCINQEHCFKVWELSLHELKYEMNHALTMGREEYEDLSIKAKLKGGEYYRPMDSGSVRETE